MKDFYTPSGVVDTILFIIVSFVGVLIAASGLQYLLEWPYFTAKKEKSLVQNTVVYHQKS